MNLPMYNQSTTETHRPPQKHTDLNLVERLCRHLHCNSLLDAILNVIVEGHTESYLCCILLMNLSYLQDAKAKLV